MPQRFEFVKCWTLHDATLGLTIPKSIREVLGIKSGDRFFVTYNKDNHLIFKKLSIDEVVEDSL